MEGKIFTIFTYPEDKLQNQADQNRYDYKSLSNQWISSSGKRQDGEKGGKSIKKKITELATISNALITQQPQELIPIEEPKVINFHIEAKKQDQQIIETLKKKSNRLIMSVASTWDFFPTVVNIQETKVSVIFHDLLSTQVHSMDIKDISNIFIESSFIFANLTIITRTFIQNDIRIAKLKKQEAIYARRLIEGLRLLCDECIDTSKYEVPELIAKLEDLSQYQREI